MKESQKEIKRIPRPQGATNLARTGLFEVLEDKVIDNFLIGLFPYGGGNLDMFSFSSLYNIPLKKIKARMNHQLSDTLEGTGEELRTVLEEERLKALGGTLGRIGRSDFEIHRLLRFLGLRVLSSSFPDPNLVKEINSAIGNQIRLSEVQLKAIATLDSHLNVLGIPIQEVEEEEKLTNAQILERLAEIKVNPDHLKGYLEGTPDLDPLETGKIKVLDKNYNRIASHDYEKLPEVERIPQIEDIPISPR